MKNVQTPRLGSDLIASVACITMSVASAIDVEQLQAELRSARMAFDKWAQDTVSAADQLRENHVQNISDLKGSFQMNGADFAL